MKKYLYLFSVFLFTSSLSSYNLNLPVENTTWREFLFVKSREKKNPSFLQMGITENYSGYPIRGLKEAFVSFHQDLNKFYFNLFLPFGQFAYLEFGEKNKKFVSDDIGVICGYKFVKNKTTDFTLNLGGTVPTSSESNGDIGLGIDFSKKIWRDKFRFDVIANYRYLFGYSEFRVLGIDDFFYSRHRLIGEIDPDDPNQVKPGTALFPAKYRLNQKVNISGHSLLDILLNFSFKIKKVIFDIGLDYLCVQRDKISWNPSIYNWQDNKWGFVDKDGKTITKLISKEDIDLSRSETPSYQINTFYIGLGGIIKQVMLGVGLNYRFDSDHEELESLGIWGKVGFVF